MGCYLFIIAYYDVSFRGEYIKHEENWRHSWQCNLSGTLSTLSSEASVFILTVITVDRYLSVSYPFSLKKRTKTFAIGCMVFVWSTAFFLATLPLLDTDTFVRIVLFYHREILMMSLTSMVSNDEKSWDFRRRRIFFFFYTCLWDFVQILSMSVNVWKHSSWKKLRVCMLTLVNTKYFFQLRWVCYSGLYRKNRS